LPCLTLHGFNGGLLLRGDHRLGGTVTGTNINKRGQHCNRMHKHMIKLSHDVIGIDVS
jgi:beta-xylosidase